MRACVDCGQPEDRRKDASGRPLLNLDPVSGKCIQCLVQSVQARPMPSPKDPIDWARKAANDED